MKHIATLPYDEIDFVFISSHYDIHLSGLCKMGNTLFHFKTINQYEDDNLKCEIYMLTFAEELKWRTKKFLFEQMVGHHWSYPKKDNKGFYYKKPEWLYKQLFKLYYKLK